MNDPTLFSDFLQALGVPHTAAYSDKAYRAMPFRSCFGLKKLLERYGVESEGVILADKTEIAKLPVPFLARMPKGFVIVEQVSPDSVCYRSGGAHEQAPAADFTGAWTGMAFLACPAGDACEPDYRRHELMDGLAAGKKVVLWLAAALLAAWGIIGGGLWRMPSVMLLLVFDCVGLLFTFMLVQKSLHIKSGAIDRVCGVLQKGGCDDVLATKASSFFGLFGWSEVGFAYFSVSLAVTLAFPQMLPQLALCNVCCLPFSFWSIWYQKTRAKAWCTLCVSVQATLWALFFCYLGGGWLGASWPPALTLVPLTAAYAAALLGLNRLMPLIEKNDSDNDETDITP